MHFSVARQICVCLVQYLGQKTNSLARNENTHLRMKQSSLWKNTHNNREKKIRKGLDLIFRPKNLIFVNIDFSFEHQIMNLYDIYIYIIKIKFRRLYKHFGHPLVYCFSKIFFQTDYNFIYNLLEKVIKYYHQYQFYS